MSKPKKGRVEKHNKWGYIFLTPVHSYICYFPVNPTYQHDL